MTMSFRQSFNILTFFLCIFTQAIPHPVAEDVPTHMNLPTHSATDDPEPGTESVKFWGWEGCSPPENKDGPKIIEAAWDSMLDIANAVKGNIKFDGQVSDSPIHIPPDGV